jgi:hypothetical protein
VAEGIHCEVGPKQRGGQHNLTFRGFASRTRKVDVPQTVVPTDSRVSSSDAVAAVFAKLHDGDADSRPAATTACPPRLRRVVAFMSANQAIRRVEDALTTRDASPEVTDV